MTGFKGSKDSLNLQNGAVFIWPQFRPLWWQLCCDNNSTLVCLLCHPSSIKNNSHVCWSVNFQTVWLGHAVSGCTSSSAPASASISPFWFPTSGHSALDLVVWYTAHNLMLYMSISFIILTSHTDKSGNIWNHILFIHVFPSKSLIAAFKISACGSMYVHEVWRASSYR